jgi:D-alanine-D-alanine ligase
MEIEVDRNCDGGVYSYTSKQEYRKYARYKLIEGAVAEKCGCVALGAWRALGCRDGGRVDLRMNGDEEVQFLEVNPLAGLHPVDSDFPILAGMVGIGYRGLIERIMVSATDRMRRGG